MKLPIKVLTDYLNGLDNAYDKCVINRYVSKNSKAAKKNRQNAQEIKEAINLLTNHYTNT